MSMYDEPTYDPHDRKLSQAICQFKVISQSNPSQAIGSDVNSSEESDLAIPVAKLLLMPLE